MKIQVVIFLLLAVNSCGQTQDKAQSQVKSMSDYSLIIEKAHPKAKAIMKDSFYFNPIDETSPFGNDDGADTYASFKIWRLTHLNDDPTDFLFDQINEWGYPKYDIYETDIKKLTPYLKESDLSSRYMSGIDAAIIAIAFGQLYLEGAVNKKFKETAIIAIKRQLIPEILALWGDSYKLERAQKLKKMLSALSQVN